MDWLTTDVSEALAALWKLREDNLAVLTALSNDGPVIHRAAAWVTLALSEELGAAAPYLTGTLSSAHRGTAEENIGLLFIADDVTNPVFLGKPVQYGEEMNLKKPWWNSTFEGKGDQILAEGMLLIEADMDDLWT